MRAVRAEEVLQSVNSGRLVRRARNAAPSEPVADANPLAALQLHILPNTTWNISHEHEHTVGVHEVIYHIIQNSEVHVECKRMTIRVSTSTPEE